MTPTDITSYNQRLDAISIPKFLREDDANLSLGEIKQQFRDSVNWSKRLLRNSKYLSSLPAPRVVEMQEAIGGLLDSVDRIESIRTNDPTSFIRSKHDYLADLNRAMSLVYTKITEPLRSYLVFQRGKQYVDKAEESLNIIEDSQVKAENATSATQEAAADTAAHTSAEHYSALADEYDGNARKWTLYFFLYSIVLVDILIWIASVSQEFAKALLGFDTHEGIVLKFALLLLVGYGFGFIAKNYQTNNSVAVIAKTRKTMLLTWRAFVSAEELNTPDTAANKAYITEIVAKQIFSDIPLAPEKRSAKLIDNPVNVFTSAKSKVDDAIDL